MMRSAVSTDVMSRFYTDARSAVNEACLVVIGGDDLLEISGTDPTFATDTGWTPLGAEWTIGGGVATCTGANHLDSASFGSGVYPNYRTTGYAISAYNIVTQTAEFLRAPNTGTLRSGVGRFVEAATPIGSAIFDFDSTFGFLGTVDNPEYYQLYNSDPGNLNVVERVDWSYDAAPTNGDGVYNGSGMLQIVGADEILFQIDIVDAGPGFVEFGKDGIYGSRGDGIAVLLHSDTAAKARLSVKAK